MAASRQRVKHIVALILFCAAIAPACIAATPETPTARPNIILCMTDDQGWGDVSYNGLKKIQTPNIDAMAAAGLRFNRFYAQQSCSPTRASVMTGRHPNRIGVFWPGMKLEKGLEKGRFLIMDTAEFRQHRLPHHRLP